MNRPLTPGLRAQRGFTIMELVIAIVIMGILSVVGVSMISDSFTTARTVNGRQSGANDARYAVERLAREIREVKYANKTTGYQIPVMGTTNMEFTNGAGVVVKIAKTGTDLKIEYSTPAVTSAVATQVTDFSLQYLKVDPKSVTGATSTTDAPTDVRFVVISVTVKDSTSNQQVTERVRVALRNMCETNPCT